MEGMNMPSNGFMNGFFNFICDHVPFTGRLGYCNRRKERTEKIRTKLEDDCELYRQAKLNLGKLQNVTDDVQRRTLEVQLTELGKYNQTYGKNTLKYLKDTIIKLQKRLDEKPKFDQIVYEDTKNCQERLENFYYNN
jgi:hypothetical protein